MNNELEHGHEAYVPQRENTKVGFWVFLSGEVILFGALIGSFLLFKSICFPLTLMKEIFTPSVSKSFGISQFRVFVVLIKS